jgi:protein-L-isoaspartate(D-aspartate) O-methyltransferase
VANLGKLPLGNITLSFGDGMLGAPMGAPFMGIIAACGGEAVPQAWVDQLAVGGRIVAPVDDGSGRQLLTVVDKTPRGVQSQTLDVVQFVPLKSGIA